MTDRNFIIALIAAPWCFCMLMLILLFALPVDVSRSIQLVTVAGLIALFFGSPFLADMKLDSSGHQRLVLWIGLPLNVIMSVVGAAIVVFFIVASRGAH
jgi:hypothetical protein